MNKVRKTGSFRAKAANGQQVTIEKLTTFIVQDHSEGTVEIEGITDLRTTDGRTVNRVAKGHYQVLDPFPIDVKSDDPAAP